MTTGQKQRATEYLSNIWLITEESKKKGVGVVVEENKMEINTVSCWLEKQTRFPPAGNSVLTSH